MSPPAASASASAACSPSCRIAWADYFGRASFGAIRGAALTVQVTAQASGPLLSGLLRDFYGTYVASLTCFAALSFLSVVFALLVRAPRKPEASLRE